MVLQNRSIFGIAVLGSGIIAITYGLARFVFGLFLPEIREDLGLDATGAGIIGALPFVSFVAAILVGPAVCERLGPRWAGGLAVGLAAAGLSAIAGAPGVVVLGAGVAVCGISTGLSSPVMAQAVQQVVGPIRGGRVNAIHNAGTSVGVALAMPAMAWWLDAWRSAYMTFALLTAVGALAALAFLPGRPAAQTAAGRRQPLPAVSRAQWRAIGRVSTLAGGMGLASSIYWVFAPDLVVHQGGGDGPNVRRDRQLFGDRQAHAHGPTGRPPDSFHGPPRGCSAAAAISERSCASALRVAPAKSRPTVAAMSLPAGEVGSPLKVIVNVQESGPSGRTVSDDS